ncbi:cytochrome C [Acidobacteriia bacterium AH_259_A11_L15]|nr:cytochrome C [Acidobacteriia bacterium AH_259_A11_L15]
MDWHQLWEIVSTPDNIPIVALLFLIPFYTWYGLRQARANDRLLGDLENDPQKAKTHHRKTFPYKPGWPREVHVWPFLMRIEFLAAIIVTALLIVWSITLNAPLEEPANPNLTMNPAKAPWYFLGLQEMLVYFDPWIAGVLFPTLIIIGLMAIPYVDANPLGNGYYTFRQRPVAILAFCFGFLGLWVLLIIIGTFIRGPGWMWFWPGETWDHNRLIFEVNRDLPDIVGITGSAGKIVFGGMVVGFYYLLAGLLVHKVMTINEFTRKIYRRMSLLQYLTIQFFAVTMLGLPVKILLRQLFRIKYVWVTPWFNV